MANLFALGMEVGAVELVVFRKFHLGRYLHDGTLQILNFLYHPNLERNEQESAGINEFSRHRDVMHNGL